MLASIGIICFGAVVVIDQKDDKRWGILWPKQTKPTPSPVETSPNFHADLEYAVKAPGYGNTKHPLLCLFVHISNAGMPSIVTGWGLEIDRPGKSPLFGTSGIPDRDMAIQLRPNEPTRMISRSESLAYKAGSNPIPKGGAAGGLLYFALKDLETDSYSDIFPPGAVLILSFRDFAGKQYSFTFHAKGQTDEFMIAPGMNPESVHPETREPNR